MDLWKKKTDGLSTPDKPATAEALMGAFRERLRRLGPGGDRTPAGRPFVTVTYAQSVDGSIAGKNREQLRLSGDESMCLTHHLRAAHDAILVGIGTVMADDPRLNVRRAPGRDPQPVVLDTHFRTPETCRLLQHPSLRPWIMGGDASAEALAGKLSGAGAMATLVPTSDDDRVDLPSVLRLLLERGVGSLMVEGGAQVITSFVRARLVDQFIITVAPRVVGGLPIFERGAFPEPAPAGFSNVMYRQLGPDLIIWATPAWGAP
jgi:3,4-dihydroxy 2-butanone 4-phosphate synthase/GTP cyclohydrolase II